MDLYNIWLAMTLGTMVSSGGEIVKAGISPKELYENRKGWHNYDCFNAKQMAGALEIPLEAAHKVWQLHCENGISSVNYTDSEYPSCFRDIPDAPLVLFYKGDLTILENDNRVGVVGSRNPDRDGVKICEDICTELAQNGVTIISGLAQGMDSISHICALRENAKTVAFIGTSVDKYYPAANRNLQNEIAQKGCVVSEYYMTQQLYNTTFIERNRLIAAASDALCVVQAKAKSGTLSTAKRAQEYSKQLFAVPGSILNPMHDGTNRLIQDGAYPLLSAKDVLLHFGMDVDTSKKKRAAKPKLTEIEQRIYDCLGRQTMSVSQ
ncbi:MAG: DNA-processing protein DprA, partial [Oscillospiraceae bacterium]|nr:DNA-processing protein DprA [Oscillospiraceae bacterium]